MAYNRDVLVAGIKRHYDLLVRFAYLDPAAIETPPPTGWTDAQLAVDFLRALGRNETVIDLLRHMPYIKHRPREPHYEVHAETKAINYLRYAERFGRGATVEVCAGKTMDDFCLFPADANWPASFISLTEGREGLWWIIDTDEGVIFPNGYSLVNGNAPRDQPWRRGANPRNFQDYFDQIYDDFVSLRMVPMPISERSWYNRVVQGADREGLAMKDILLECGWPDEFRKDEYLEALRTRHPDTVEQAEN